VTSWIVDVISPAMAERLADPRRGPRAHAGLPGTITRIRDGCLRVDGTALASLLIVGWHDDGRVTWDEDDTPVLHIGKDRHPMTADAGQVF
jgi:hypothetical protein